jgi:Putative  PD-(D/E)XK family member, (DUF4420)
MTSIEALWDALELEGEPGGARRVDESHPCDLYAGLDANGRRGLILVTDSEPPRGPRFEAVDVGASRRQDQRWSLAIWLVVPALLPPFSRLCQDLVEASREIDPAGAAAFLLTRLARWRRLLEPGSGALPISELRGLAGELVIVDQCLRLWSPSEVIDGWVGPLDAPQDFSLPSMWIEAKATLPTASVIRITSVDQLDASGRLLLAVVTLANVSADSPGVSPASLVEGIRRQLTESGSPSALLEFDSKLATLGYADDPAYAETMFRIDRVRFFDVADGFPAIRRGDLPPGVAEAVYDVELSACAAFETSLTA